ncbi:MAG: hypothetical protein Salg2KO_19620 [Salibacteraceae bacterium]
MQTLQSEFEYFKSVVSDLRQKHPQGGHVVIKDQEVHGVWESRNKALEEGLERFGNVVFLVRSLEDEPVHHLNFSFNKFA